MPGAPQTPRRRSGADPELRSTRQDEVIVEAAWCYYHEGLTQGEIAERLGISRASVVNYLAEARRREYVRITLDSRIFGSNVLAEGLKETFGLAEVLVVPAGTPETAAARVIRTAADWLPRLLAPGDRLGVAWGETIYRLADAAPNLPHDDLTVVQLLGSRSAPLAYPAEACSSNLARKFDAACINLHVPLLLTDRDLCERLKAEPLIAEQLKAVETCNKVVFAAGTCADDSHLGLTGLISSEKLRALREGGACGVICGHLINAFGQQVESGIEDRMIGATLEQLRRKEVRLLVAAGSERTEATHAALQGGFATHLATSSDIAISLMTNFDGKGRAPSAG